MGELGKLSILIFGNSVGIILIHFEELPPTGISLRYFLLLCNGNLAFNVLLIVAIHRPMCASLLMLVYRRYSLMIAILLCSSSTVSCYVDMHVAYGSFCGQSC